MAPRAYMYPHVPTLTHVLIDVNFILYQGRIKTLKVGYGGDNEYGYPHKLVARFTEELIHCYLQYIDHNKERQTLTYTRKSGENNYADIARDPMCTLGGQMWNGTIMIVHDDKYTQYDDYSRYYAYTLETWAAGVLVDSKYFDCEEDYGEGEEDYETTPQ